MRGFHQSLSVFKALPIQERLFVRARLFSAPLESLEHRVVGRRVLDVGCGHGVLSALIALGDSSREVVGIDPDARKIEWARASVGRTLGCRFDAMNVEQLAAVETPASFDTVVIADVLYLLPAEAWPGFFACCRRLLRPNGRLLFKDMEDDGSWRVRKALAQEAIMVHLLGRTKSSGSVAIHSRARMRSLVEGAGLEVTEIVSLSRGYTTPHVVLVARPLLEVVER
jgi:2-polyprenyl-6-hydroxyphenyl methylase/3-demethylubiquinone-9 3-methyltransferase